MTTHPLPDMLTAGTCVGIDLGMGFAMFLPAVKPTPAPERGPGRPGTTPSVSHWNKIKPTHGGYPDPNYTPVAFPTPKKNPFSIVRN